METAIVILAVAAVAAVIAFILQLKRNNELTMEKARVEERLEIAERERERTAAEAESRMRMATSQIIESSAERSTQITAARLRDIVDPLKERVDDFRRSVSERMSRQESEQTAFDSRVRELLELNRAMNVQTNQLTAALKGNNRVQGDWGEVVLENILTRAGLAEGREFRIQETVNDGEGRRLRPDVIVDFPDGRSIVIDSKTSMTSYMAMLDATDATARDEAAKAHIASVKNHIATLKRKSYQDVVKMGDSSKRRPEYVVMFMPLEGAFIAAINAEPRLWDIAFESGVIISSPTHLLGILKIIEQLWRGDRQRQNAVKIADEAGKLLDKFHGFLTDMERIDKSIEQARGAYDTAMNKLTSDHGGLIKKAESLKQLGVSTKRPLPDSFRLADADDVTETDLKEGA